MTTRKSAKPGKKPDPKSSKTDQLRTLLASPGGMTVEVLSAKLSWQTHTTRAALTRLKQAGVRLEKLAAEDGSRQSRYRIVGARK